MSSDWDLSGLDELMNLCDEIEISDAKENKALNAGGEIILKAVEENAPNVTGKTKKSIKKKITKNEDGDKCCKVYSNLWYDVFTEYGSSKNKKYIGWFNNSVDEIAEKAIEAMKEVILK